MQESIAATTRRYWGRFQKALQELGSEEDGVNALLSKRNMSSRQQKKGLVQQESTPLTPTLTTLEEMSEGVQILPYVVQRPPAPKEARQVQNNAEAEILLEQVMWALKERNNGQTKRKLPRKPRNWERPAIDIECREPRLTRARRAML
jgi:hypothetical protein